MFKVDLSKRSRWGAMTRIKDDILSSQKFAINMALNCRYACGDKDPKRDPVIENRADWSIPSLSNIQSGKGKIALIVGAGPSLKKNIHLLYDGMLCKHLDKVDVFVCDSMLRDMLSHRFVPDYMVTGEMDWLGVRSGFVGCRRYVEGIECVHGTKMLMSLYAAHDVLTHWCGDYAFYIPDVPRFKRYWWPHQEMHPKCLPVIIPRSPNVLFHMIEVARYLQYDEAVIIGADFCIEDPKQHHYEGFGFDLDDGHVKAMGMSLKECLRDLRHYFKSDFGIPVTNCTEGGVLDFLPCMTLADRFLGYP